MNIKTDGQNIENHNAVSSIIPDKNDNQAKNKTCFTGDMLLAVNDKIKYLKRRETEIAARQAAYEDMEKRILAQLSAVKKAKSELDKSIQYRTDLARQDIVHLTTMYQTMKPKQAAAIFNEMDVNFAAGFLREMKSNQAGLILSNMKAKKAYQISLIIASKGARYRKLENKEN